MMTPIKIEAQNPYIIVAPKWLSAPEYRDEVNRFTKGTGYIVVFAEDFLPMSRANDNQES